MSLQQPNGDPNERVGGTTGPLEIRKQTRSSVLAHGTLACPECDAPVSPAGPVGPADPLACGFCGTEGRVRDFLTLGQPTRPMHVVVRVVTAPAAAR